MDEYRKRAKLYALAKRITLEAGYPWTDPRTGKTYHPGRWTPLLIRAAALAYKESLLVVLSGENTPTRFRGMLSLSKKTCLDRFTLTHVKHSIYRLTKIGPWRLL